MRYALKAKSSSTYQNNSPYLAGRRQLEAFLTDEMKNDEARPEKDECEDAD